ncbi:site-specific integrase, partial [Bordetella hinzii]|nr:site-specific integrase [Bordetella hinzii]
MSDDRPLASQADIDAFIDAIWLEDGLAANTLAAYRRDLSAFALWLQAPPPGVSTGGQLCAATSADIESWFAARHEESRPSTANRRLAALRRFYAWALREKRAAADPCLALEAAKQPLRVPKTLSEAQVEALLGAPDLDTARGLRDRAMLEMLYATGLRVSELVSLKTLDVSMTDG